MIIMWKKGPLPAGTYNWGGCVPFDHPGTGFYFTDFRGDHAITFNYATGERRRLEPHEIAWWNNALDLPPADGGTAEHNPPKVIQLPNEVNALLVALLCPSEDEAIRVANSLAIAVLMGDRAAALVLKDKVEETWEH